MRRIAYACLAVACGALVAWLGRYGAALQVGVVVGAASAFPLMLLFVIRPYVALASYLLVLPIIVPLFVVAGMNLGEWLTLLVVLVGGVSLLGTSGRLSKSLMRLRALLLPLAALALVALISLLVNEILRFEEIVSALFKIMAFAAIPVLLHVHVRKPSQAKVVLAAVLVGGAVVAGYTLLSYVLGWSYSAEHDWRRPVGTFEHWNQLGGFMALVSLPTLGLAGVSDGGRRVALVLLFGLEIGVLLLSLTLGSMAGVLIGSALVLVFLMRPRWSRLAPVLLVVLIATTAAFAADPLLREKVTRIDERVNDRLITYATGINMFRDRFWWGFGSEQNMAAELFMGEADYGITAFGLSGVIPHNAVLKIAVEKGLFGVITFTALVFGALHVLLRHRSAFRRARDAPLYYGLVAGIFAFLVQNMTNDLLLHARMGIIFFSLIALVDRLAPDGTER